MSRYSTAENFQKKVGSQNVGPQGSSLTLPLLRGEEPLANRAQEVTIEQVQQAAQQGAKDFDALLKRYIVSNGLGGNVDYDQIASLIATSRANGTPPETRPASFDERLARGANDTLKIVSDRGDITSTDIQITSVVFFASDRDVVNFDKIKDSIIQSRWKAFSNKIDQARNCALRNPPEMTNPMEVVALLEEASNLSGRIKDLPNRARSQEREEYLRTESESILKEAYQNGISQQLTAASERDLAGGDRYAIIRHLAKVQNWLEQSGQRLTPEQQELFNELKGRYPLPQEGR